MEKIIDKDWTVEKLVEEYPHLARLFVRFGLPCIQCGEPVWGTIGENCTKHGVDTEEFVKVLNEGRDYQADR
ncbi:DUF1858 domain-containing protein [bacterium]|nr:DUF1858 domain-containing protein [bacterium]